MATIANCVAHELVDRDEITDRESRVQMSKLRCNCGHVIIDQKTKLPYAGTVISDQDEESIEEFTSELAAYFNAVAGGRRGEWMARWYGAHAESLQDVDHSSVVFDIFLSKTARHTRKLYQCEACGRLHLESTPGSDGFRTFTPETDWHNALARADVSAPER